MSKTLLLPEGYSVHRSVLGTYRWRFECNGHEPEGQKANWDQAEAIQAAWDHWTLEGNRASRAAPSPIGMEHSLLKVSECSASKPSIGGPRLTEGQTVWNAGHQFIATGVTFAQDPEHDGFEVMRYTGVCTAHDCNDSIRHTCYNGGTYGYRVEAEPALGAALDALAKGGMESCGITMHAASDYKVQSLALTVLSSRLSGAGRRQITVAENLLASIAEELMQTTTALRMLQLIERTAKANGTNIPARSLVFASFRRVMGMGE